MKSIYILKAYFFNYKPTSKMKNRVFLEKIDFLSRGGGRGLNRISQENDGRPICDFMRPHRFVFCFSKTALDSTDPITRSGVF